MADVMAWHGSYLNEEELFLDILAKVKADPEGVRRWIDPSSWKMPVLPGGGLDPKAPEHAGSLMFAGMSIRNFYGLWHADCPYTVAEGKDMKTVNGIVTDERHPDNLSGRVIQHVRDALVAEIASCS